MSKAGIFAYARKSEVAAFEGLGWKYESDLPLPHGNWSVLMRWTLDDEPKMPDRGYDQGTASGMDQAGRDRQDDGFDFGQ